MIGASTTSPTCAGPGCTNPPRPRKDSRARVPIYCDDPNCRKRAYRQRQAEKTGRLPTERTPQ